VSDSSSLVVTSAPIIVKRVSSAQLNSSLNPAYFRNAIVTLTAVVSAESGVPTGSVTFQDGDTLLGTANLNAGTAILTVSNLRIGSHRITRPMPVTAAPQRVIHPSCYSAAPRPQDLCSRATNGVGRIGLIP